MRHNKIFIICLILLVLVACQSASTEEPVLTPSPGPENRNTEEDRTPGLTSLQADLSAAGAEVALEGSVDQSFFSVQGQILTVNGEPVQVFEYPDPALADADAGQVAPDGSSIGTTTMTWVSAPHFFRAEQLIALYIGENSTVLELLASVLGPQFAGAGTSQGPGLDTEPPAALVTIGEQEQTAGIGSYCWSDNTSGTAMCIDKVGLPTVSEPLQVNAPFSIELTIPLPDDPPAFISLTTIPVTYTEQMETDLDGMRWWPPKQGDNYNIPLAPPHQLELDLDPGLYVLRAFVQWQNSGDVDYGFLIEILPVEDAEMSGATLVRILAEAGLNLRDAPGIDSEVIGILPYNEVVTVTGQSPDGAWWQIACSESASGECWISADSSLSTPINQFEYSLAGLIYRQLDQQPEQPLWRVAADGNPVKIMDTGTGFGAISPDARQVVLYPSRGETNLTLVDLGSGERLQLTDTPDRYNFNPQFWPANPDTIIFISRLYNPNNLPQPGPGNLAMVRTDGTGFQLLDAESLTHTFLPALAPDGNTIAYDIGGESASEDGILNPWLYHLEEGPAPFDYTAYGLQAFQDLSFGRAAWSPDGRYLAWVIGGELTGDGVWKIGIAMFDLEEQSVELINPYAPTSGPFVGGWEPPVWSPNSEWLAWYVSPQGGLPGFWLMRPDGSDQLLFDQASSPVWSPDGSLSIYPDLTTGAIMVMETEQWQPQRTDLPAQIGIITWINPDE